MLKKRVLILTIALLIVSVYIISAAETSGSLGVDTGGGNIIIETSGCQEDWSGSTWSQCNEANEQVFICFDRNLCGTDELKPAQCGETRACETEETGTGGGGGGGGSGGGGGGSSSLSSGSNLLGLLGKENGGDSDGSCEENWECSDWSNAEDSCGIRTCRDLNECGTNDLKPETSLSCSGESSSGLTGAILGGIQGLSKSKTGASLIFVIAIAVLFLAIAISRARMAKAGEKLSDKQIAEKVQDELKDGN